ncbi:glutamate receptor 1-like isoform X1 [Vespula squamosa]|uniref:Glutamate receptor 1-like isoform X1 n=1 Tax=Vespula squamosa TaxID=30214 RepID=A0ABD1ZXZ2_VESSQ
MLKICQNKKLAIYSIDQDYIVNMKIPCNVVRIATKHVNSIAITLSKHSPFTDLINFHDKQIPFTIEICKLYGQKSAVLLYAEPDKEMKMTTIIFKWRRAFSQEGIATTNLRFSQLQESFYYVKRIIRPYYIVLISNYNEIKEFSLATRTFDMSSAVWLDSLYINVKKNGELGGIYGNIFRELCISLNFSIDIVSEVKEYGRWNPKEKTWSGAIAEIYYGRADISLSDFSMTNARLNAIDFTVPVLISKECLFFQKPEIFAIKWSSYFLCSFAEESSNRSSLRIAYFSIFLLVTILSAAYCAALISFLTTASHALPFHSLESFVEDGTYQFSVFRGTAYYDKFANSEDPLAKKLMKLMPEEDKLPMTVLEVFTNICKNRKLAIYTFDQVKQLVDPIIPCNVVHVETEHINNIAIILSKHNPFTDVINFHLRKFIGNGIMSRLKHSPFETKSNDMIKHEPIPLMGVISLFIFIQIGIVISTCILIIEKCIFACKRKKMSIVDYSPSIKSSRFYMNKKKNIRNITKHYTNRKCTDVKY